MGLSAGLAEGSSVMEGLGTGPEAVTLVSFQGQAALLIKDCVRSAGGAPDSGSALSAHENPHSGVVATGSAFCGGTSGDRLLGWSCGGQCRPGVPQGQLPTPRGLLCTGSDEQHQGSTSGWPPSQATCILAQSHPQF